MYFVQNWYSAGRSAGILFKIGIVLLGLNVFSSKLV